ncbi:OpgC domain-containing protein [Rubellimicrobium roseum]|uniref:DUF1624 domain-containing protein n=1 Tax=Rubellimicrobium roseum TaxID=687525 RepID=A0A5C4NBW9_9RHOB|nr:OpgC domain-containing protein [Rubellimicrobium roseum]TNC71542.1 hypothetical protein FHG71_11430 [Rubellimicrobium roseum]
MRYQSLDGLRGLFLILMMEAHVNAVLRSGLGRLDHHDVSWADAAHGFVLLSGLVAGLVYTRILARDGASRMTRSMLDRVRTVYAYHAATVLALLALALAALALGRSVPLLAPVMEHPAMMTALALGLVADLDFLDILPMYVVFMAVSPGLLRWMWRGRLFPILAASGALWLMAQGGLGGWFMSRIEAWLPRNLSDLPIGIFFDLMGWQLVFVVGMALGHLVATGRNPAPTLLRPDRQGPVWAALGVIVALAVLRLLVKPTSFGPLPPLLDDKARNSVIYLLSLVANGYVVAWLLVAAQAASTPWLRAAGRGLTGIATWRPLVFLGQHSLQAFAAHVVYVYALALAIGPTPLDQGPAAVLFLTSPAPLFLAAWLHSAARHRRLGAA